MCQRLQQNSPQGIVEKSQGEKGKIAPGCGGFSTPTPIFRCANLIQNVPRRLNSFPTTHTLLILELIHTLINIQKVLLNVCRWQCSFSFSLCQRNLLAAFWF